MPDERFDVRYTAPDGRDQAGRAVPAASVEELVRGFAARGLQVSEVRGGAGRRLFEPRRFGAEEFALFNAELAAACRCGVPLPGALRALSRDLGGRRLRREVEAVAADLEAGADLPSALAKRSAAFPPAYVALIRAGLAAGNLAGALLLFSEQARLAARVRRDTANAMVYPLIALFGASVLLGLAGGFFLPMMQQMFADLDIGELPMVTDWFLSLAPAMRFAPLVLLALLAGGAICWRVTARWAGGAVFLGRLVFWVPLVGRYLRAVCMARFCQVLAAALAGRVGVPESVALAGLASGNAAVARAAARSAAAIREGGKMSESLNSAGRWFPATLVWMLGLGEERGEVAEALREYARLQAETAERLGRTMPVVAVTIATVLAAGAIFFCAVMVMGTMLAFLYEPRLGW